MSQILLQSQVFATINWLLSASFKKIGRESGKHWFSSDYAGRTGSNALAAADSDRYAARAAERFPFLRPDRIKDANGRRPDHADYDANTLWIPSTWFKEAKVSEGQRQWQAPFHAHKILGSMEVKLCWEAL